MSIGATEITLVLLVVVLLFGASKLPDLARGTGSALRIFKTETKGLLDDDSPSAQAPVAASTSTESAAQTALTLPVVDGVANGTTSTGPPSADPTRPKGRHS